MFHIPVPDISIRMSRRVSQMDSLPGPDADEVVQLRPKRLSATESVQDGSEVLRSIHIKAGRYSDDSLRSLGRNSNDNRLSLKKESTKSRAPPVNGPITDPLNSATNRTKKVNGLRGLLGCCYPQRLPMGAGKVVTDATQDRWDLDFVDLPNEETPSPARVNVCDRYSAYEPKSLHFPDNVSSQADITDDDSTTSDAEANLDDATTESAFLSSNEVKANRLALAEIMASTPGSEEEGAFNRSTMVFTPPVGDAATSAALEVLSDLKAAMMSEYSALDMSLTSEELSEAASMSSATEVRGLKPPLNWPDASFFISPDGEDDLDAMAEAAAHAEEDNEGWASATIRIDSASAGTDKLEYVDNTWSISSADRKDSTSVCSLDSERDDITAVATEADPGSDVHAAQVASAEDLTAAVQSDSATVTEGDDFFLDPPGLNQKGRPQSAVRRSRSSETRPMSLGAVLRRRSFLRASLLFRPRSEHHL